MGGRVSDSFHSTDAGFEVIVFVRALSKLQAVLHTFYRASPSPYTLTTYQGMYPLLINFISYSNPAHSCLESYFKSTQENTVPFSMAPELGPMFMLP